MEANIIGVIGGSGLYHIEGMQNVREEVVETPFGSPSAAIVRGTLNGVEMAFLPRHGVKHTILPSEINYRANIYALKKLGARWCLSVSAVGSLKEEFAPGSILIPDQLIDRTYLRPNTFFGDGAVAHVSFAEPYCPVLRGAIIETAQRLGKARGFKVHTEGTYVCMEGPAFSTRAESHLYRSWGASIIGMTALPEAKLAREAEIAYATIALVTDYDCWRDNEAAVDVAQVIAVMKRNSDNAKALVSDTARALKDKTPSALVTGALANAIMTRPADIPSQTRARLGIFFE